MWKSLESFALVDILDVKGVVDLTNPLILDDPESAGESRALA